MGSKLKDFLRKYPIVIGIVCVGFLMGFIVINWYIRRENAIVSTTVPPELARESNIDALSEPELAVEYYVKAVQRQDLDQALRVFPIDEICLNIDSEEAISMAEQFGIDTTLAPSSAYLDYFPISSAELTGNYASEFEKTISENTGIADAEIKGVEYIQPEMQNSSQQQLILKEKSDIYGADAACEMRAVVEGERTFIIPVTLVRYDTYWKIAEVGASLDAEENSDEEMYNRYAAELEDTILDGSEDDEEQDESADQTRELIETGEALLPPNYFITTEAYGDSPEDILEQFVLYIHKKDLTTALTLGNISGEKKELGYTSVNTLEEQSDFAQVIKYFYYSFLFPEDVTKEYELDELGMSGKEIVEKLNPDNFFYLEKVEQTMLSENEYEVIFKYEGEYFRFIFEFSGSEEGWQIHDIRNGEKIEYEQK